MDIEEAGASEAGEANKLPNKLAVVIGGTPRPLPRPRFVNGRVVSIIGAKTKTWRRACEAELSAAVERAKRAGDWPVGGDQGTPIGVSMDFMFASKKQTGWKVSVPDIDNLVKLVMDAATNVGVFADDRQVVRIVAQKSWTDGPPGCLIMIEELVERG